MKKAKFVALVAVAAIATVSVSSTLAYVFASNAQATANATVEDVQILRWGDVATATNITLQPSQGSETSISVMPPESNSDTYKKGVVTFTLSGESYEGITVEIADNTYNLNQSETRNVLATLGDTSVDGDDDLVFTIDASTLTAETTYYLYFEITEEGYEADSSATMTISYGEGE